MKHHIKAHMYHCRLHSLLCGTSLNTTRQTRLVLSLKLHLSTCIFCTLTVLTLEYISYGTWGWRICAKSKLILTCVNQVCWSLLSALKWRFSPLKGHTEKKLNTLQAGDNLLLRSVFDQAKGKIGYMEKLESGIRNPESGTGAGTGNGNGNGNGNRNGNGNGNRTGTGTGTWT